MSTGVSKISAQRNHRTLMELVLKPGNDICADCKTHAPRWASYNLGIFICVNCASIHRKIGTHVTKVKSITLDQWSKEQVEIMKENGNAKSNALYNPNEARHPPPTNMIDSERDSELEKFIRSKYEFKRFMDRKSGSAPQQLSADARAATVRSRSTPLTDLLQSERRTSPGPPLPPKTPENLPPGLRYSATIPSLSPNVPQPARSASQPLLPLTDSERLFAVPPFRKLAATQPTIQKPAGQVWEDLISLQGSSQSSSLPLQYSPATPVIPFPSQPQVTVQPPAAKPGNAQNPFMNLSLGQAHTTPLVASPVSVSTPGAQFAFVPPAPLSSPALHLGSTNPFNQAFSSASVNGTLSTSSNPFSSSPMPVSIAMSTMTPFVQPVIPLPTGAPMQTQPLGYVPSQTPTPTRALSFSSTSFAPASPMAGLAPNPFTPAGAPSQVPLSASVARNPFSVMQMGQMVFSGMTSQAVSSQQQPQLHGFNAWAGQGVQGTS